MLLKDWDLCYACVAVQVVSSGTCSAGACSIVQPCARRLLHASRAVRGLPPLWQAGWRGLGTKCFQQQVGKGINLAILHARQGEGAAWGALRSKGTPWHGERERDTLGHAAAGAGSPGAHEPLTDCWQRTTSSMHGRCCCRGALLFTHAGTARRQEADRRRCCVQPTLGRPAKAWVWGQLAAAGMRLESSSRMASLSAFTPSSTSAACSAWETPRN